ncbi:hypothetical protein D3C75_1118070 [compost metagenome]
MALNTQAAFKVVPRLAPQAILQAQPTQCQQQARIFRVLLEPTFGGLQLTRRIAATHQAIEPRQMAIVITLEGAAQNFFGLDLGSELP